jgi:hypothetical protein
MKLINGLYQVTPYRAGAPEDPRLAIIAVVVYLAFLAGMWLAGEWVPAWLWFTLAFLVAVLGVTGLGFWVLRGDALNRRTEEASLETESPSGHH